ncbi:MAG TPA: hypothetical protein VK879_12460 [Candidatus Sulfomarinibacteraceae bacterium]|nr:hypothetical protein [Candidatus Sulfomarinibacteraceae bacterium]
MARKRNERVRQTLLLAFVLVSVILVGLIWADGLRQGEEAIPGYYREVDNGSMEETSPTLRALPANDDPRDGHGPGPGASDVTPTPGRNLSDEEM